MLKHVLRAATVSVAAALPVTAVALPSRADVVPDGCVGSTAYYACTGSSTAPTTYQRAIVTLVGATAPVAVPAKPTPAIGGFVLVLGGETVPGTSVTLGGPTDPVSLGVAVPVDFCVYVACYAAGDPVYLPGLPLPYVPVVVPNVTVPSESVPVPTVVPAGSTPAAVVPLPTLTVATVTLYATNPTVDATVRAALIAACIAVEGDRSWAFQHRCVYSPIPGAALTVDLLMRLYG